MLVTVRRFGLSSLGVVFTLLAPVYSSSQREPQQQVDPPVALVKRPIPPQPQPTNGRVELVDSPFLFNGTALLLQAGPTGEASFSWDIARSTASGARSLTFMHVAAKPTTWQLFVYSSRPEWYYVNSAFSDWRPQFAALDLVLPSVPLTLEMRLPAGSAVLVGHLNEPIENAQLRQWPVGPAVGTFAGYPSVAFPEQFTGHDRFIVRARMRRAAPLGTPPRIFAIRGRTEVGLNTGLLPRLLPGMNTLQVRAESAGELAAIEVNAAARDLSSEPHVSAAANDTAPADGTTFSRVHLLASDGRGAPIAGVFLRMVAPTNVCVHPYVFAVSDWAESQRGQEFHVTSSAPGEHALPIEIWTRDGWRSTHQSVRLRFVPAPDGLSPTACSDLARDWFAPRQARRTVVSRRHALRGLLKQRSFELSIPGSLAPEVLFTVTGPVTRLRVFSGFQPDPESGKSVVDWLKGRIAGTRSAPENALALAITEFVDLVMDNQLQFFSGGLQLNSARDALRYGSGWCGPHAFAVGGLALEGSLAMRFQSTPSHVFAEIRDPSGNVVLADASLGVNGSLPDEHPGASESQTEIDWRALGLGPRGVDGRSQRHEPWSIVVNNYQSATVPRQPFLRAEDMPAYLRHQLKIERLLAFDLLDWESLTWQAAHVRDGARTKLHPHQTLVSKQFEFSPRWLEHPAVAAAGLFAEQGSLTLRPGRVEGSVSFPIDLPGGLRQGYVVVDGTPGDAGDLFVDIIAVAKHPALALLSKRVGDDEPSQSAQPPRN